MFRDLSNVETARKKVRRRAGSLGATRDREALTVKAISRPDFNEMAPPAKRKRKQRSTYISVSDKIKIVHQVLVEHEMQHEVAQEFRISKQAVSRLVCRAKRNKNFLDELMSTRDAKQQHHQEIVQAVQQMNQKDAFLDSISSV